MLKTRTSLILQAAVLLATITVWLLQNSIDSRGVVFWAMLVLCAIALAIDALASARRKRRYAHFLSASMLAIMIGPAAHLTNIPFQWISAATKLRAHESEYLELVRQAETGIPVTEFYIIQAEPEKRYSIVWDGLAGSWWGVVHDGSQTFPIDCENAFGSHLARSLHLWGPWYYVVFD